MNFPYQDVFVTLAAVDLEIMVEFYRQLLNQDPQPYFPQIYAEFQLKGLRLGIFRPKVSHQSEFADSTASGMSLCFEVENLEAAIAYFHFLGFPPAREITTASHGREIYAYDPAGNRLILHQSH
ncbi:MAG: VOC family protein [Oscillatoria sp. PMC 1051.18]|nr:VOC family protein [Oscillatoria sp. PMC 1050.18]MEC5029172.1 VOC family protein [Oscillatoria sp. PMC 1051.18]